MSQGWSVAVVVQARLASTRLPGKALLDVGGKPLVFGVVERAGEATAVTTAGVATTVEASDDPLAAACADSGVPCFRGPVDDLASRLLGAARAWDASTIVRLWGDCPFVAPDVVDDAVAESQRTGAGFVSNSLYGRRTYPAGLDLEVWTRDALERLVGSTDDPRLREFPAEWAIANEGDIGVALLQLDDDRSAIHLTVDYPEDLAAARSLTAALAARGAGPTLRELLRTLDDDPSLLQFADGARNPEYRAYLEQQGRL